MKVLNINMNQLVAGGMSVKEFDEETKNLYLKVWDNVGESQERLRSLEFALTKGYACFKNVVYAGDHACWEE